MTKAPEAPAVKKKQTLEEFKAMLLGNSFKDFGGVFNEQLQTSFTARTFNRLKFEPQIAKLLAVPLLLAFPFEPLTGEMSEEGYNARKKFRPFARPDEFLMAIKALCHEDAELKKKYMDYAGVSEKWDTKPTPSFTETDRKVLFIYRRPMTATHPAIKINSQSVSGEKFGGNFLLQTKQDSRTGEFIGDISNLHKLGLLSNTLQRLEIQSLNQAIENKVADCVSLTLGRSFMTAKAITEAKSVDSDEAKTIRMNIKGAYPLGNVSPLLVVPMINIDLTPLKGSYTEYIPNPKAGEEGEPEEIEQLISSFRNPIDFNGSLLSTDKYAVHNKIDDVIGNAFPKDPSKKKPRNVDNDVYANFVILEWMTDNPAASFATDAERNAAAQKMEAKMEREASQLFHRKKGWNHPELEGFMERLSAFYEFAGRDSFIDRMPELLMANYKVATEVIEDRALKIFSETFNLGPEFEVLFNPDTLATHKDVIMLMWPDDFADKFAEIEDKIDEGDEAFDKMVAESASDEVVMDVLTDEIEISADEVTI